MIAERRANSLRLDRVVVGVDFSAPSIAAVRWTRSHFAPQSECMVVHAVEEAGADLVVVGEHAHPRGVWSTLGSTAEALVRSATVPVLLARNPSDHPPQRILVAVDESSPARSALAWANMLARRFDARVTICHVFQPYFLGPARALSGMQMSAELEQSQRDQTRAWLEATVHDAGFGRDEAELRVEPGDPVSALVAAQRGGHFDLVVLGSRGAGGAGRMLLGSVASGVLRGATCPVLVVSDDG